MDDADLLATSRIMILIGLFVMTAAAGNLMAFSAIWWPVAAAFAGVGFLCFVVGLVLLITCYRREDKIVIWNQLPGAMNGKCSACGTPAHVFREEHVAMARCVVCGGTIELLTDEGENTTEVDDVFRETETGEAVGRDAPPGGGDRTGR